MNGQEKSLKDKEFTHDGNFAPKQNERDYPLTGCLTTMFDYQPHFSQKGQKRWRKSE